MGRSLAFAVRHDPNRSSRDHPTAISG